MAGRVEPPTFDGDITTFSEFKESFESLFGSLDDLTKLGMLISCLGPEPKRLISGLRRIDRNFKTAMIILTKEYDKAPLVRHTLLSRIRTLQPCDEEEIRLREIYLSLSEVIHQLLPEDSDDTSEILSNMVQSKLPSSLQCRVFMEQSRKDRPIRVFDILNMIGIEVERERIEAAIRIGSGPLYDPPDSPSNIGVPSRTNKDAHYSPSCRLCHTSGHYPDSCSSYSTSQDRLTIVIQRNLCRRCLGSNHITTDCRTTRKCSNCRGNHHTAICESANQQISETTKHHPPKPGDRAPTQHITSMAIHDPDPVFNAFLRYGDTVRDGRDDHFL